MMGTTSLVPVIPQIMTDLEVSQSRIGLVITSFTAPGFLLLPIFGILAGRTGRKPLLVLSLMVTGVFGVACAFVNDFYQLLLLRLLQGIGSASLIFLCYTLVGDIYSGEERTTVMGYTAVALSVSTVVFPVIGGGLGEVEWRYVFLLPVFSLLLGIYTYSQLDNSETRRTQQLRRHIRLTVGHISHRNVLVIFGITFCTFVVLYGPVISYFPVLLSLEYATSSYQTGVFYAVCAVCSAVAASVIGPLVKRLSVICILWLSACLQLISLVPLWKTPSLSLLVASIGVFGVAIGLNFPARLSLLIDIAVPEKRAEVMSLNGMVAALGMAVGPAVTGLVADHFGIRAVFGVGSLVTCSLFALLASFSTMTSEIIKTSHDNGD